MSIFAAAKIAAAPYLLWIYLGVAAVIAGGVLYYGHTRFNAGEAKSQGIIEAKSRALRANARAFGAFADTFREIDRNTQREIDAAAAQQASGKETVAQSEVDRIATAAAITAINRAAEIERATCADGRKPICGVPLR